MVTCALFRILILILSSFPKQLFCYLESGTTAACFYYLFFIVFLEDYMRNKLTGSYFSIFKRIFFNKI
ncbi:hypothetical protein ELI_0391 [Eubacterium callanderi]|uniref:Uncharacterized protein n=1 Tax=Eubacterium callanderi TaxID=53442 RepID=E3GIC3_9FIRM|nr:hypothetical protein ELI_0391 [Eubacterium callanderi]